MDSPIGRANLNLGTPLHLSLLEYIKNEIKEREIPPE